MNHGPDFQALEAELYGGNVRAARAELRALGPRLKRVGQRSDGWAHLAGAGAAAGARPGAAVIRVPLAALRPAIGRFLRRLRLELVAAPAGQPAGCRSDCRRRRPAAPDRHSWSPMPPRRAPAASRDLRLGIELFDRTLGHCDLQQNAANARAGAVPP